MKPIVLVAALGASVWGSGTSAWELNTYQDFVRGRFQGVSLSRDGQLTLSPKIETLFSSDQPVIWSLARGPNGALYAGTGHRGRVYRIDGAGKSSLVWTAEQPEVFALAVDPKGVVYAATSPDGKIYRIENGQAAEYFNPKAKYIWSLALSTDGTLYAGTGDQGKVFRIEQGGKGEVYYETGQSHITGLAIDREGRLLAGSEPNGILYRISAKDKAFVLYDANLPEIRAIVPTDDGSVYVAALGGSMTQRTHGGTQSGQAGASGTAVTAPATSITVEASAQAGAELKLPQDANKQSGQPAGASQVTTQFAPVVDLAAVEKSAVYRINPDNTVETLWSSKEENVYDLLALEKQILFSTDGNGRIYGLSRDRKVTLVLQTNDAEATRLVPAENSVLAATANMGHIYRLGDTPGASGSYESPVHDAGSPARWGSLSWRAMMPANTRLAFRTRSGNSAKPDRTWSEWSDPLSDAAAAKIASPNARYIQWKADLTGAAGATPVLDNVTVAYLPQNTPPVVKSINVMTQMVGTGAAKAAQQAATAAYSVTVTDTGDATAGPSTGTPTQTLARAGTQQISVTWQAEDPDGDRLVYAVYFRGEGESQWKLLRANLRENAVTFDGDVLADGKYYFRVVASDREVNPPPVARTGELVSAPVMVDNTPPLVTLGIVQRSGNRAQVEFEAMDAASPLRRAEYSLDASAWTPLEAADGVIDSQREKFVVTIENLPPGEHLLVVRAVDSANNAGLAKLVLR